MTEADEYPLSELEVFAIAQNWKDYFSRFLAPFIAGRVLEVGAGLGDTTAQFLDHEHEEWVCIEPDARLFDRLRTRLEQERRFGSVTAQAGTVASLDSAQLFDTILYVDVLEHIREDHEEMRAAYSHLSEGGRILVLAPAHQYLYSPFDRAIGHHRRYSKRTLARTRPNGSELVWIGYLDSVGLLASAGNRLFLKSSSPTESQVRFWDTWLVPCSRILDPILRYRVGKSVVMVFSKPSP